MSKAEGCTQAEEHSDLPTNWAIAPLGEVYNVVGGGTPSTEKPEYWGDGTPWVTSADILGVRDIRPRKKVTDKGIENSTTNSVPSRTLLVVTRVGLGKIAITEAPTCFSQDVQGLIQSPDLVVPEYALHFLSYELQILKFQGRGTTISGITKKQLTDLAFPLAPLAEQKRIVAKIEELLSELEKGVECLCTAQQQLKIYRQALLKQAFEGKLTSDWRAQNSDKLESAEILLTRIQLEREVSYQEQLLEWTEVQKIKEKPYKSDREPAKPKAPKILPPLSVAELSELPELPESWKWVQVGEVFGVYVGSTPSRGDSSYWGGEIPWVSSGEVAFCRIKDTKEKITEAGYLNASTEIHPAGSVMLAMIGEGKTRGQAAILDLPATHNQNTAAIRVSEAGCMPEFMYFYLCFQYEMTRKLGSGNNQKALNKERVSVMKLPFCSLSEQRMLVQLLEEKLSVVEQLEKTITDSLQQARALRQSILKKAFSGKLADQNSEDEPANVLLERIRSERAIKPAKARSIKAKA
ncbi:type I restriction enzyme, S subunit [Pseudomonas sp. NFPP10]|uniref:restriction endonuclease subunit S n=1 Tax=unclassified Pseudomonas TaxID=196821 RepID=UPI0008923B23|nr:MULTISPECIES: restriction endonuclease subunit S [unclassified Pseudomonas]SDA34203.1 type I restriction enzyme, S subunit [Pseudomonas sp. NFPP12]SEM75013.1 type I restriction enzyme, S subunit [Pseudomonas sp. NFPP10]SFK35167.1 type I restriction enzyme, S subunit [Pseudomonas sp. NFPP08]SFN70380.1 type I restriction enzyme, S subunit [Pseudomonas sp. NFPP05]SFY08041.1 type I restriction enzyme, S subunit [Pseudomonas sp. NFPP09]